MPRSPPPVSARSRLYYRLSFPKILKHLRLFCRALFIFFFFNFHLFSEISSRTFQRLTIKELYRRGRRSPPTIRSRAYNSCNGIGSPSGIAKRRREGGRGGGGRRGRLAGVPLIDYIVLVQLAHPLSAAISSSLSRPRVHAIFGSAVLRQSTSGRVVVVATLTGSIDRSGKAWGCARAFASVITTEGAGASERPATLGRREQRRDTRPARQRAKSSRLALAQCHRTR